MSCSRHLFVHFATAWGWVGHPVQSLNKSLLTENMHYGYYRNLSEINIILDTA